MPAATLRRISMKALARYQVILLGEQRHIRCEQLAQGCCPNSAAVGVEPATSRSRVQRSNHYTTEPPCMPSTGTCTDACTAGTGTCEKVLVAKTKSFSAVSDTLWHLYSETMSDWTTSVYVQVSPFGTIWRLCIS